DGVLLKRVVAEGASVPIGGLIAVLGKKGESADDVLAKYGSGDGAAAKVPAEADRHEGETEPAAEARAPEVPDAAARTGDGESPEAAPSSAPQPVADDGHVKASPLARRMAQDGGLDLRTVQGSGPDGRIVKRDVEAALQGRAPATTPAEAPAAPSAAPAPTPAARPAPAPAPASAGEGYAAVPLSQMRKTIARRLAQSKFTAPHFYLNVEVDMERAVDFRDRLNAVTEAQGLAKVSFNDLITKACAVALRLHPAVNSSWMEEQGEIRRHREVHVAVAGALDEGLVTPVIRHADRKGLAQIAQETRDLAGRARDRKLEPSDWEGSTFTTSNLGMFGIE